LEPLGPVERFNPVRPAVAGWAYKLLEGTGRYVGVAGRETGVGIELVVVVLRLPADSLDCGRRMPVFIVLWLRLLGFPGPKAGAGIDVETPERYAVGAEGLESLRLSLSLSFGGEGESSIIRTHPEDSPPALFFFLLGSASLLRLESLLRLLEYIELLIDDEDEDADAFVIVNGAGELAFGRVVILPMRNRGTRV
jgi:hypothetical protein